MSGAADVLAGFGARGDDGQHSPFALALFEALRGEADLLVRAKDGPPTGDGVITATELYTYLRDRIETGSGGQRQTPGLWALHKHHKGEFVFLVPGRDLDLPLAPPLNAANNPYRGLEPFEEQHKDLFFGRATLVDVLRLIVAVQPLTVVLGASGTGKSSLVRAGLIPRLRGDGETHWEILGPVRPGTAPPQALIDLALEPPGQIAAWAEANPERKMLLVVDQLEELVTLCRDDQAREQFLQALADALAAHGQQLRVVLTVRSDFEPQFATSVLQSLWTHARFVVSPMTQDDLREAIVGPAAARVLSFEPDELVDRIINEVVQTPGALPLLSFTLSELYIKYLERRGDNRALTAEDYEALGGVAGSLRTRASAEYQKLDADHQATMRRVLLRMVSLEGGELARRRVLRSELEYADPAENARVATVITQLSTARLVVEGREAEATPYVEPAHDALVRGWDLLWRWVRDQQDALLLQRRVTQAALDWMHGQRSAGLLWDDDPRLRQAETLRQPTDVGLNRLEGEFVTQSSARRRWVRLRTFGAVGAAMLLLVLFGAIAMVQSGRALERGAEAQRQAQIATARQLGTQALSLVDDQLDLALLLSLESYRLHDTFEARSALFSALGRSPQLMTFLRAHDAEVDAVAFSPDGKILASGSWDKTIVLWDAVTHKRIGLPLTGHTHRVMSVAFSSDGKMLASAGYDHTIMLWDVATRKPLGPPLEGHTDVVHSVAFSPDGTMLASGSWDNSVRLWDIATGQALDQALEGHTSSVQSIAWSPNGQTLASGSSDGTVIVWDVATRQPRGPPLANHTAAVIGNPATVWSVAFSPDGKMLAASGCEKSESVYCRIASVRLWDVASQQLLEVLPYKQSGGVLSVAWSSDGKSLASSSNNGTITIWDVTSRQMREPILTGHHAPVWSVAWSPDGRTLASASYDRTVGIWNVMAHQRLAAPFNGRTDMIFSVAWSPDGKLLASGDQSGKITAATMTTLAAVSGAMPASGISPVINRANWSLR